MGAASPPATQHNEILITDNRVTTRSYSFSAFRADFARAAARAFRDSPVYLVVDHPAARARARFSQEARTELLTDLTS